MLDMCREVKYWNKSTTESVACRIYLWQIFPVPNLPDLTAAIFERLRLWQIATNANQTWWKLEVDGKPVGELWRLVISHSDACLNRRMILARKLHSLRRRIVFVLLFPPQGAIVYFGGEYFGAEYFSVSPASLSKKDMASEMIAEEVPLS